MTIEGKIRGEFWPTPGAEGNITSATAYNDGKWHHIAFTASATTQKLYLDGTPVGSRSAVTDNSWWIYSFIGTGYSDNVFKGFPSAGWHYFNGSIDEVRIWNVERSEAQIKANMYKEISTNANLKGYYKMSNGTGTSLTDNSGNSNTGTLTNGPVWTASGCFAGPRNALSFSGADDYVSIPHSATLDLTADYTLEAWIYPKVFYPSPSRTAGISGIISKYQNIAANGYFLRLQGTNGRGISFDQLLTTDNLLNANTWYHIAGVKNGSSRKLYVNGCEVPMTGTAITVKNNTDDVTIGLDFLSDYDNVRFFNGNIDEVRIWSAARTQTEIRENMMRTLNGDETNLAAYYRCDHADGADAYDLTANANNGTMYVTTGWVTSYAFNTWVGSESNAWSTAGNWSFNATPASTQNVGIYQWGLGNECAITGAPTVNHLLISSTAASTLGSGMTVFGNLLLENTLALNSQTLTMESSASAPGGSAAGSAFLTGAGTLTHWFGTAAITTGNGSFPLGAGSNSRNLTITGTPTTGGTVIKTHEAEYTSAEKLPEKSVSEFMKGENIVNTSRKLFEAWRGYRPGGIK